MTKIKKLVALALAFLMVFASVSILASAWDANTSDGKKLTITTKYLRYVNGAWQETETVKRGEAVKARVYITTAYFVGNGELLFFYNKDFFEDSYSSTASALTVNTDAYPASGWVYGSKSASTAAQDMYDAGKIDEDFLNSHNFLMAPYTFESGSTNQRFKATQWFCEFDLTVKEDAAVGSTGSLFAVESTARTEAFTQGIINVSKVQHDKTVAEAVSMSNWTAELAFEKKSVSLYENYVNVTFDANGGKIGDSTTYEVGGNAGDELTAPTPTKLYATFRGWALKGTTDIVTVAQFPTQDTEYVALWAEKFTGEEKVSFKTEIFRYDETANDWVYTERVKPGEQVKARFYIDTNYFTNSGDIMLFYDSDFFTDSAEYGTKYSLVFNTDADSSAVKTSSSGDWIKTTYNSANTLQRMVAANYITKDFLDSHTTYTVNYRFTPEVGTKLSGDTWYFEFDLTVRDDASGTGNFFMVEETVQTEERTEAYVSIPINAEGADATTGVNMSSHTIDIEIDDTHSVSTYSTITFDANGGTFSNQATTFVYPTDANITANIGDTVDTTLIPVASKPGSSFAGWVNASIAEPTEDDIIAVPEALGYTDISLKAYWVGNSEITFIDANGTTTKTVVGGDEFEAVTAADKEGHYFAGWTTDPTFEKITGLPDVYPTENTTYYAVYSTYSYEIRYYVSVQGENGFKYVAALNSEYGTKVVATPPTYTVPDGYSMSAAYTNPTLTTLLEEGATVPVGGLKLYYAVVPNTYDIIFDANGGKFADGATTKTVPTNFADRIAIPTAPTYEGYEFTGWSPDVSAFLDTADTVTYTATWTPKTYDAKFYSEGELHDTIPTEFGAEIDEPQDPERDGYVFIGWSPEIPDTMPAKDMIFNAKWEKATYTVSFDAGKGTFADGKNVVTYDALYEDTITAPAKNPARSGFTFLGWAKSTTPDTVITDYGKVGVGGESFVAVWGNAEHRVTFYTYDVDEHTDITEDTFKYAHLEYDLVAGEEIVFPETDPAIDYFVFKGWVDEDGNSVEAGIKMPDEDFDIYAKFERVAVKLVPKNGSTTVVERDGAVEKLSDNSVTPDRVEPATAGNFNKWYVYGLKEGITKTELEQSYVDVLGDGRIVITPINPASLNETGTGSLIEVYDNVTNRVVEKFYVVIFGDINGDAKINARDVSIVSDEAAKITTWSRDESVAYKFKAANVHADIKINQLDLFGIKDHSLNNGTIINQVTGLVDYDD